MIHKCLQDFNIDCKHVKFDSNFDIGKKKGLICNNGDHFFLLMNFGKFWINFDSLSENGPEYLFLNELIMLIIKQIENEGSFIELFGDLPRVYSGDFDLMIHQKLLSINEILEGGQMIKAIRESQKPVQITELSFEEQMRVVTERSIKESKAKENSFESQSQSSSLEKKKSEKTRKKSWEEIKESSEEFDQYELELAKKLSTEEPLNQPSKKIITCRENKFNNEELNDSENIEQFLNRINEKIGYSDIELYIKYKGCWLYSNKTELLSEFLNQSEDNIIYLTGSI